MRWLQEEGWREPAFLLQRPCGICVVAVGGQGAVVRAERRRPVCKPGDLLPTSS